MAISLFFSQLWVVLFHSPQVVLFLSRLIVLFLSTQIVLFLSRLIFLLLSYAVPETPYPIGQPCLRPLCRCCVILIQL